jgi:transposase
MVVSKYKEEFRQSAVQLVSEKGKSVQQVAKELGICVKTLRDWIERHNKAQRSDSQSIQDLESEVKRLKKELAESQETVEILKKTTAILSKR